MMNGGQDDNDVHSAFLQNGKFSVSPTSLDSSKIRNKQTNSDCDSGDSDSSYQRLAEIEASSTISNCDDYET